MMDVNLQFITEEKSYVLNISELKELRESMIDKNRYFDSLLKYFQWYNQYCDDIFKNKVYDEDTLIREVFMSRKIKTDTQYDNVIQKHLYLCNEYVKFLQKSLTQNNLERYKHNIWRLDYDIERLILIREGRKQNISEDSLYMTCGIKRALSTRDMFDACRELFYIENIDDINKLYLMDLKPVVTFQIRQIIELYGKRMLGLGGIYHHNDGSAAKQFTQIAWTFIKERNGKSKAWNIELPFNLNNILALNDWANGYTHTAKIDSPYLQYYALNVLTALFVCTNMPINTIHGSRWSTMFAPIKISGYSAMKKDFENYIQPQRKFLCFFKKKRNDYDTVWASAQDVQAYILSE